MILNFVLNDIMKNFLLYFALVFSFYSCNRNESKLVKEKFPVLIDTFANEYANFSCDTFDHREHYIYFVGKETDSINIDYWYYHRFYKDCLMDSIKMKEFCDTIHLLDPMFSGHIEPDDWRVEIKVDTSSLIGFYIIDNGDYNIRKAYPVFIYNLFSRKVTIGMNGIIDINYEAKDVNGNWKKIEDKMMLICGTGSSNLVIYPNEIAITSVLKYSGSFETKLRVELDGVYSNEFTGYVNLSQFEPEEENRN
jgi:hypothetical protein